MSSSDEIPEYPANARVKWVNSFISTNGHTTGYVTHSNFRLSEVCIQWDCYDYVVRYDLATARQYIKVTDWPKKKMPEMEK